MYETERLQEFARQIEEEVADLAGQQGEFEGENPKERAFTEVVIGYLEENGMLAGPELCHYDEDSGRSRCRFSGFSFTEDGSTLRVFTTSYRPGDAFGTLKAGDISKLAGRATQLYARALKNDLSKFAASPDALDAAKRIVRELDNIRNVEILILSNGVARDRDVDDVCLGNVVISYEVIDLERLFRSAATGLPRDDILIDFEKMLGRPIACLEMKPAPSEYATYLVILSGDLLFQLYEKYGPRLLEFNVRSFLQARGNVNRGIRDTLRNAPERFMAYNNGIAATADEIDAGEFHGETAIKSIRGLQIVNGAQTTASIHRAKRHEKIDVSGVAVAMKLTKVEPRKLEEFVPLISRFANTQNVIQIADLSANHRVHIEIERLSEEIWCPGEERRWFYERTRGQYQVAQARMGTTIARRRQFRNENPSSQKFTKTDLAKVVMSFEQRPHTVSMGAQKNFTLFMSELNDLYGKDWVPDEVFYRNLISRMILFRSCERVVRREKFPAFQANIITYLVASVSRVTNGKLDLDLVWEQQSISSQLNEILRSWSHSINEAIIETADDRNVTEWCKKEGCWDGIRLLDLELPASPIPELRGHSKSPEVPVESSLASVETEDAQNIDRCMSTTGRQWFDIHSWGVKTGLLNHYERGVAHTLSSYALEGWQKKPSPKQARLGAKAMRMAKRHGIL